MLMAKELVNNKANIQIMFKYNYIFNGKLKY